MSKNFDPDQTRHYLHARIQKILSEAVKYLYKRAIIGPPAKRHLNDASLECRYWPYIEMWLGSFVIIQGSGPIAKETICDILEGVLWTPSPHLDPRMAWMQNKAGHCYVLLDLVQTVCIKKWKNSPWNIINGSTSDLTLFTADQA